MSLTDVSCRSAKPGPKVRTLSDGGGLQLRVLPSGGKAWRLAYRFGGSQKTVGIGPYPTVTLREAREARDRAKRLLLRGVDPTTAGCLLVSDEAQLTNTGATDPAGTLKAVAEAYFAKLAAEGRTDATIDKNRWLFAFVPDDLASRSVASIRAPDLLPPLRALEARGLTQSAGRLRGLLGSIFRYAAASGLCEADPTALLRGALVQHVTRSRAAVTDRKRFAELIRAVWTYEGQPETTACLKLLPILVPRPGELRQAEWGEFDLDEAVWTVPAGRMKMRRPHSVPLPRQAVEILKAHRQVALVSRLVFPGLRSADRPISENTTNAALRRLGFSKDEATSHGFRATFATLSNESGLWHPDAIERQLAHIEGNEVRRAYTRGEHWGERVRMMQWWADTLDAMQRGG